MDYDIRVDPFEADRSTFMKAIKQISHLPNLEMNFKRGDSLHDHISGIPVIIAPGQLIAYQKEVREIQRLGAQLHRARKSEKKRELRIKILEKRLDLSERVLEREVAELQREDSTLAADLFGETASASDQRKRIAHEVAQLKAAIDKVAEDRRKLERLSKRKFDPQFLVELRRLEGADFDSPFNFAWRLDFPTIFSSSNEDGARNGFDIIVGNPPFVTARNPEWRELWRERWKRVCEGKYHMLCPFFNLGFDLLHHDGQLGYIVSNAFAKREFGRLLVEEYFPTLTLQKVVDCSGLLFPGHGTPTCIVLGKSILPPKHRTIRITGILPGGGDLRTPPEESALWHTIEAHHDHPAYQDTRICVADRQAQDMSKWPWNLDVGAEPLRELFEGHTSSILRDFLGADVGFDAITGANDIYYLSNSELRRCGIPPSQIKRLLVGELNRDYSPERDFYTMWPYEESRNSASLEKETEEYLILQKPYLSIRSQFRKTQLEARLEWFEYREYHRRALRKQIAFARIATHFHALFSEGGVVFNQEAPIIELPNNATISSYHLLSALLNSHATLFWLKQVCFNKGAGKDEVRDRFDYAGHKIHQVPVPPAIAEGLRGQWNDACSRLAILAEECWERGNILTTLVLKKLFEKPCEAYCDWEVSLPGYVAPHEVIAEPFTDEASLRAAFETAVSLREKLRCEMIARQEEMDWLVYAAYDLIPFDSPAIGSIDNPMPIERLQRSFVLWSEAKNDLNEALGLIPREWPTEQRKLWEARLRLIAEDEHIRRLEQPVYKRRWDEQWKIGNSWACGEAAYAQEFIDAFGHWLMELAEHTAEALGGEVGVSLPTLTDALWTKTRVVSAWPLCCELQTTVELYKAQLKARKNEEPEPSSVPQKKPSQQAFEKYVKALVRAETVPEEVPYAQQVKEDGKTVWRTISWDEMKAQKTPFTKAHQKIRGKLNVPRERFTETNDGLLRPFRFKVG